MYLNSFKAENIEHVSLVDTHGLSHIIDYLKSFANQSIMVNISMSRSPLVGYVKNVNIMTTLHPAPHTWSQPGQRPGQW